MARSITLAAAEDLSADILAEARDNLERGYYRDGYGLQDLVDALDAMIADARDNGEDEIAIPADSDLEAAADHHGV